MSPDTYIPHRVEKLYGSSGKGLATCDVVIPTESMVLYLCSCIDGFHGVKLSM